MRNRFIYVIMGAGLLILWVVLSLPFVSAKPVHSIDGSDHLFVTLNTVNELGDNQIAELRRYNSDADLGALGGIPLALCDPSLKTTDPIYLAMGARLDNSSLDSNLPEFLR